MKINVEYQPYPLPAATPYNQTKEFILMRYQAFLDQGALNPQQKESYFNQFLAFANHIEKRLNQELRDRQGGKPHANLPYHAPHMWQAAYDAINVGKAFIEKNLVPEQLAFQTPRNGLTHDVDYLRDVNTNYPTFAHNIVIHVPGSIGSSVKLMNNNSIQILSPDEHLMSLYATALEIHGTHFASPEEMKFHHANRQRMIEKFAQKFGGSNNYEYMKSAAEWMCKGSRLWDLWGQLAANDYLKRLPDLQLEMNAATPAGEPPKGDLLIGKTPEEQFRKSASFIKAVALDQPTIQSATILFGPNNAYEEKLRSLTIISQQAA